MKKIVFILFLSLFTQKLFSQFWYPIVPYYIEKSVTKEIKKELAKEKRKGENFVYTKTKTNDTLFYKIIWGGIDTLKLKFTFTLREG